MTPASTTTLLPALPDGYRFVHVGRGTVIHITHKVDERNDSACDELRGYSNAALRTHDGPEDEGFTACAPCHAAMHEQARNRAASAGDVPQHGEDKDDPALSSVWFAHRDRGAVHPTQKPVALPAKAILNSSKAGGIVLDPFGGSGSTLFAADGLGRHARIMELDAGWVDVIVKTWEKDTGLKARREA